MMPNKAARNVARASMTGKINSARREYPPTRLSGRNGVMPVVRITFRGRQMKYHTTNAAISGVNM